MFLLTVHEVGYILSQKHNTLIHIEIHVNNPGIANVQYTENLIMKIKNTMYSNHTKHIIDKTKVNS